MKLPLLVAGAVLLWGSSVLAEKIALVGDTVINPHDGKIIPNAILVMDGNRIESIGTRQDKEAPDKARTVDCAGKVILPGYIDAHVHFFHPAGSSRDPTWWI